MTRGLVTAGLTIAWLALDPVSGRDFDGFTDLTLTRGRLV